MATEAPPPEEADETPLVAEVIAIGDELTTGQRLDTNSQWLAQRLTDLGLVVRYHTTVADDLQANVEVFQNAAGRADVVVSTGGLGPTADDLTRDAMAAAAGVPLVEHSELVEHTERLWTSRGRAMPPQNRRQAQLPEHARAIPNPGGTAPGVDQTVGRCRLFALPGVPAEMVDMWTATVAPAIAAKTTRSRVTCHWLVKCFGAGESAVEGMLPDLIARGRYPLVGITASQATITLRVTASGADEAACLAAMEPTLEEIRTKLGDLIYAEQPGGDVEIELSTVVMRLLVGRDAMLAVTEGMTGGLLAHWLIDADAGRNILTSTSWSANAVTTTRASFTHHLAIGNARDGVVPIEVITPQGAVQKDIQLVGHPSIQRPLVAKHALNLLRLELLKQSQ
ncbi:competence/damage-inducible protein A [Botrimarina mediterranea]|uniref:NMN amidohydrolase-like protein YfaY n=1 Tax=Botrimarina mediterranea TaxID=2528022 RepID=A0A518K6D0_9BACT|nr:molybdopterin-binding protein [Botrimarina mediterranea]QDV73352.1 NMN amidohydrolase-like protein YfaY [Botrimarina mediterranea]QDV77869.1 NMN amidohydrolase-like protein YfaY [Planctomycetes bacterium K2D]